jgi:hypothetical protein
MEAGHQVEGRIMKPIQEPGDRARSGRRRRTTAGEERGTKEGDDQAGPRRATIHVVDRRQRPGFGRRPSGPLDDGRPGAISTLSRPSAPRLYGAASDAHRKPI